MPKVSSNPKCWDWTCACPKDEDCYDIPDRRYYDRECYCTCSPEKSKSFKTLDCYMCNKTKILVCARCKKTYSKCEDCYQEKGKNNS